MNPASTPQLPVPGLPNAAPRKPESQIDLGRSLRMHRMAAVAAGTLVFLALLGFGLSRHPYYDTQALLYVKPMNTRAAALSGEENFDQNRYETFMQQQLQTITRPDVLTDALKSPAARGWRIPGVPMQTQVAILQHSLHVERVEQSYQISIGLSGNNPQAIADMVNAVSAAYIHDERADELAQTDQQMQILQNDRHNIQAELAQDRAEQARISVALGVADTSSSETLNPFDTQLTELRSELAKATAAHDVAVAEAAAISSASPDAASNVGAAADAVMANDPSLLAFKQSTASRISTLTSQMAGLTPQNPLYQQNQREIDDLNSSLLQAEQAARARAVRRIHQERDLDVRRTAEVEARLRDQLAENTALATGATPQLQRAAELNADIDRLQKRYSDVDNAISSLEVDNDTTGLVHVIVEAAPPLAPKTSMKRLVLLAAFPMGLLAALAVAILLTRFDPRIYVPNDLTRMAGFPPIAALPEATEVEKAVLDQFMLRLLAAIDQIHRREGLKTFLFSGVSATAETAELVETLARKMRRMGYSVSTVTAESLVDEVSLISGATPVAQPLQPPPSGIRHENIALTRLQSYAAASDFVLIESGPLLTSSVAEYAARLSDVVVLAVDSGRTDRGEMRGAVDLVERLNAPAVAAVLCGVRRVNADKRFLAASDRAESRAAATQLKA